MPVYDFECSGCRHVFEKIVPVEQMQTTCPKCKDAIAYKLMSAPMIKVNGSFTAETGYAHALQNDPDIAKQMKGK